MKKSWIGTDVVTFFGYEVRPGSWGSSDSRKQSINAMLFPETQKQMQSFLGEAFFFYSHKEKINAKEKKILTTNIFKKKKMIDNFILFLTSFTVLLIFSINFFIS